MADGKLIFNTDLDTSGLSAGLGKVGDIAGAAFKGTAVAVGAAATAIGALTGASLDGYAAYEQLTGGVETLFKTSADAVMGYAENAYKTSGLSANQYMETVTSFSASLIQSLDGDTAKAAKVADMAITDMSDNANKMGTDISMIQNAYNGFAKGNFTMLDNLKLGYGGTQEEMQRLLKDAEKISGIKYDMSSFADISEAIHVIQTDLEISGISYEEAMARVASGEMTMEEATAAMGTTAKEAASTIEGSTASMKAAWDNLVVGIASEDADINGLINQFIESATTMLGNIIPRIEVILGGIGRLVEKMVPVIMAQLPSLIDNVLPQLVESGVSMINSIIQGLLDNLPALLDLAIDVVMQLVNVLIENAPKLIEAALQMVVQLATGIADALPELIPAVVEAILMIVQTIMDNVGMLLEAAVSVILGLASGLVEALPQLIPALVEAILFIVEMLIDNIDALIDAAVAIIMALADGLLEALPLIIDKAPVIIDKLVTAIVENLPKLVEAGITLIVQLAFGLIQAIPQLVAKIPQIISSLVSGFINLMSKFNDIGKNIVEGIWKGISNGFSWIKKKIEGWVGDVLKFFKNMLGIHSPSKEFEVIGKMCVAGFDEGIEPLLDGTEISRSINASVRTIGANTAYGANGRIGGLNQVININREVGTPDEMARAIRLESRYGLMKGVGFA